MTEICPTNRCTGCMVCQAVCAHNAISRNPDELGFAHPKINVDLCVNCGLCQLTCPSINNPKFNISEKAFAAASNDANLLKSTASGGLASIISKHIIESGGVVYGCSGEDIRNIRHIRISDAGSIDRLKGSKYIQSDLTGIFPSLMNDVRKGMKVLFIGVSCQVAAVKKLLRKEYDNFYCIDILCHGAASQSMLNSNIDYYCKKLGTDQLDSINFRNKEYKNGEFKIEYGFFFKANGIEYCIDSDRDMFTFGYANNLIFRDSCYQCQYTKKERVSDITLGDFWGLEEPCGPIGKRGTSLVIPHTKKGMSLFSSIANSIYSIERPISEAIKGNPQLQSPTVSSPYLTKFRNSYSNKGLRQSVKYAYNKELRNIRIYNTLNKLGVIRLLHVFRQFFK